MESLDILSELVFQQGNEPTEQYERRRSGQDRKMVITLVGQKLAGL
jgi:hypothetical protein